MLGRPHPDGLAIHISPYRTYRREHFELIENLRRAEIPGVENKVHLAEILLQGWVKKGVRIGEDAQNQESRRGLLVA